MVRVGACVLEDESFFLEWRHLHKVLDLFLVRLIFWQRTSLAKHSLIVVCLITRVQHMLPRDLFIPDRA